MVPPGAVDPEASNVQLREVQSAVKAAVGGRPAPWPAPSWYKNSVRADQLLDWQLDAASGFSLDMFDGHHFFLVQHESAVLRCVRRYADEHLARWRIGAARQLVAG